MSEVIVYVEGRSDKLAMEALFAGLIAEKQRKGIAIRFTEAPEGDKKRSMCFNVPKKAVNIILYKPDMIVIALPDFYPPRKGIDHDSADHMRSDIHTLYLDAIARKTENPPAGIADRFKVFCFKHDLESLLLAAHESLKQHLAPCTPDSWGDWIKPVEDQNRGNPPKRVVRKLFSTCKRRYTETIDTPQILRNSDYSVLAERCPQQFAKFVNFLEKL